MYLCAVLAGASCDRTASASLSRVCLAAYYAHKRLLFGMSADVAQKVLCPSELSVAVRTLPLDWHICGVGTEAPLWRFKANGLHRSESVLCVLELVRIQCIPDIETAMVCQWGQEHFPAGYYRNGPTRAG